MTNFVDTVFNTTSTGGVIKYNLTHADSTTEQVQMNIATPVQTQGTALNKAFFDTIQTDLTNLSNNKLNVSNKATQSDAIAGTNDTKYITPYALSGRIRKGTATATSTSVTSSPQRYDILDLSQFNGQTLLITGYISRENHTAGSGYWGNLRIVDSNNSSIQGLAYLPTSSNLPTKINFFIYIDTKYKMVKIEDNNSTTLVASWDGGTKIDFHCNGTNTKCDLQYIVLN